MSEAKPRPAAQLDHANTAHVRHGRLRDAADKRGVPQATILVTVGVVVVTYLTGMVAYRIRDLPLTGTVSYGSERTAAEQAVAYLTGVRNITDDISADADPIDVTLNVQDALERYALIPDNSDVAADTSGNTVTLTGYVRTWAEHDAVVAAGWMAAGVYDVRHHGRGRRRVGSCGGPSRPRRQLRAQPAGGRAATRGQPGGECPACRCCWTRGLGGGAGCCRGRCWSSGRWRAWRRTSRSRSRRWSGG
jgi:hypothetical protein